MRIDFARLNHVLIPQSKAERDRLRASRFGRVVDPLMRGWTSLTEEGRVLVVVTILIGALGLDVRNTVVFVLFSSFAGLVVGSIAAARSLRLDGVEVAVSAPKRVTVGEPVTFTVTCSQRAAGAAATPPVRVRGPFLPWDGAWVGDAPEEIVVPAAGAACTTMRARFVARGVHHLDMFTAAAVAPGGMACGPSREGEATKLHVVPRVANVARLRLSIATRHQPGGVALASRSGESMDLLGVRPYRPGDPVRDLHARSWARTGIPVVREWRQEYFTRVGVVLDTDASDPDRLEAALELAAGIVANLTRGEALVDVLVLGDRLHELTVGRSLGHLDQVLDLLATVERGPAIDADVLVRELEPYLERLSSVVCVALAEGPTSRALEARISDRGIACRTVVLDHALVRALRAREPVSL